jgi:hypothetical protein
MADVMVYVDRWVLVTADYEIFVRGDPLTDPGYRVRVEVSGVGGLQVRCLSPMPAGFWLRPVRGGALYVPTGDPYDTAQFRLDDWEFL